MIPADSGIQDKNMPDLWNRCQKELGLLVLSVGLKTAFSVVKSELKSKSHVLEISVPGQKRVKPTNIAMGGNLN